MHVWLCRVLHRMLLTLCIVGAVSGGAIAQSLSDQSAEATDWLNAFRATHGVGPVRASSTLRQVASDHLNDMVQNRFFSHTGSDGSDIGDRLRRRGYGFCFAAENLAKGQRSLDDVLSSWAKSRGHRRNMLASDAQEFGLVLGPNRTWVMVLGRAGC